MIIARVKQSFFLSSREGPWFRPRVKQSCCFFKLQRGSRSELLDFVYLAVAKYPYFITSKLIFSSQYFVMKLEFRPLTSKRKGCRLHVTDRWELVKILRWAIFWLVAEIWDFLNLPIALKLNARNLCTITERLPWLITIKIAKHPVKCVQGAV